MFDHKYDSRAEAEETLDAMMELASTQGKISVDMGDIARLVKDMPVNPQEELYREMEQRRRRDRYHVDKENN